MDTAQTAEIFNSLSTNFATPVHQGYPHVALVTCPIGCIPQVTILVPVTKQENVMGSEDVVAGKVKQIKGKANDIAGAATGNTGQQIKGKAQKAAGKVQEAIGRATTKKSESHR